jgi:hypothetical protein
MKYKIVHLATGEYVKANMSIDIMSSSKEALAKQVLNNMWLEFVYIRGGHGLVETVSTLQMDEDFKYIPKCQFEIVEILEDEI